ncbi:procyclic acidic repetitive family protein [Rheinheimera hassiensis]|uniref:procyclic acidic repetitive family protein n=1 Tax=Rheinheimera hassiensis TaxID=1193627 RepID=UPI001F06F290|nr:procyclic acidic repetitive family protein [Rheinheimera hassiensis]
MKTGLIFVAILALSGCQLAPQPVAPEPTPEPLLEAEPEQVVLPEPEPVKTPLAIADDAATLQAWVNYRAAMLNRINEERDLLNSETAQDDVWVLKRTILQLHPDTPYLTRLRVQMQSADQLAALPAPLAALLSWDLVFNQKLLEAESAVSALTRLNAQQHDNIERLQKTNKELQKKIDALTQIEAQLNQPTPVKEDDNGQPQ